MKSVNCVQVVLSCSYLNFRLEPSVYLLASRFLGSCIAGIRGVLRVGIAVFVIVLLCAVFFSGVLLAQDATLSEESTTETLTPIKGGKVTPIKGGYHVEWEDLTDIGSFRLKNNLSGKFKIQFDIPVSAVEAKPKKIDNPDIIRVLANYWLVRNKPEHAMELYQKGLEFLPNDSMFNNNLAMLKSKVNKDHAGAIAMVDKALETSTDNLALLDTKGLILLNADRAADAIPVLERAVTLSCEGPLYVLHLIQALDQNGDVGRARQRFTSAQSILNGAKNAFSKDNQKMLQDLKAKYGTAARP
jgi:tetratricopeptide (TPR) repeat protein